ncbi:hypothetical protein [Singulisphaera acidiphila]|uniref:Uncharacterized protein n=1 Tax=Singulisphaera acidiphila (strain ATCC BAA-1392 / DSM 18658 / VKM B-2454 / MOB10) TaxID=886293 RepID=L0DBM0_SINAD|nr:hypothetical protein [Singulisphaera acidiphila]AGA26051.1 hypothetical protein Sinac_1675 [Singulisphaera acidiphila DSM 18658]
MWRTEKGVRTLKVAEWELFREGIDLLWDAIEESFDFAGDFETGVAIFDRLQPNQQIAMLLLVGKALRDKSEPAPDLTAMTEGTVAAVFEHLRREVGVEIDVEDDVRREGPESADDITRLRRRILTAYRKCRDFTGFKPPTETSRDKEPWEFMLDCFAYRILWDDDYKAGAFFLDAEPAKGRAKMEMLGIDPDYFIDIAPDPTDEELESTREQLRELTGRSGKGTPQV